MARDDQDPTMVAVVFPTNEGASKALEELDRLEKDKSIFVHAATRFEVDEHGKVHRKTAGHREPGKSAGRGLLIGAAMALLPGIGLLAGAAVGAVAGLVGGSIKHKGVPKEFVQQFQASLKPGSSGLLAEVQPENVTDFSHLMESIGGQVTIMALETDYTPPVDDRGSMDRAIDRYGESFREPEGPKPLS